MLLPFEVVVFIAISIEFFKLTKAQVVSLSEEEVELESFIFQKCSKQLQRRPVANYNDPVNVYISFTGETFREIQDTTEQFSTTGLLRLTWFHPCLRWGRTNDTLQWSHISILWKRGSDVWVPPLMVLNDLVQPYFLEALRKTSRLKIQSDGEIVWEIAAKFDLNCQLTLMQFPFDRQFCGLQIESQLPTTLLKLVADSWDNGPLILPATFTPLVDVWQESNEGRADNDIDQPDPDVAEYFDVFSMMIPLKRQPEMFILHTVLPLLVMLVILVTSFRIPLDDHTRAEFCLRVMLVMAVSTRTIAAILPLSSEIIFITSYSTTAFLFGFCCTFYNLIVGNLAKKSNLTKKIQFFDIIFYSSLAVAIILLNLVVFALMQ